MVKSKILKMNVDVCDISYVIDSIQRSIHSRTSFNICLSNVHMCMKVFDDPNFRDAVNQSDLVLSDGKPIYLAQKLLGYSNSNQIRGHDLTIHLCQLSQLNGYKVGFYGSSNKVLNQLKSKLLDRFPGLNIAVMISPPFRELTSSEQMSYIDLINKNNVDILFVGLGCPKQEIWMHKHKHNIKSTLLGVGAVFDFLSGNKPIAPKFMIDFGLEWLYRFCCEPRRLFLRYFIQNPRFLFLLAIQYLSRRV